MLANRCGGMSIIGLAVSLSRVPFRSCSARFRHPVPPPKHSFWQKCSKTQWFYKGLVGYVQKTQCFSMVLRCLPSAARANLQIHWVCHTGVRPPPQLPCFSVAICCSHFAAEVWRMRWRCLLAAMPKFLNKLLTASGQLLFSGFPKPLERFCKSMGSVATPPIPDSNGIVMQAPSIIICPLDDLLWSVWETCLDRSWTGLGLFLSRSGPNCFWVRPGTWAQSM